jgi:tetratricopeptide (TPR) repeat protein
MAETNTPRSQRAEVLFKTGVDAAQKSNYDYAIQMIRESCKLEPDNLRYRKTLREIERRRFNNDPAKVSRMVVTKNGPIRTRAKMAKAQSQWAHVLDVCEEAFVNNPWDVAAAEHASEAAEKLGLKETCEWLLEAVATQANDADFFRRLAYVYELNEHWQKAIQAWERVYKLNPHDQDAKRQINALSASATIQKAGLNESIQKKPEQATTAETLAEEAEELKLQALSPEERLLKEIQEQPQRVGPYLELNDHYKMQNRLDEAEKVLALGLKNNPNDALIQSAHAEVQIARIRKSLDSWTKKSEANPADASARAKVDQLKSMLAEYVIKEIRRCIDLRPDDMGLHLKLGKCLSSARQFDPAIGEFQKVARSEPSLKAEALLEAGKAFEANNVFKLAERSYQEALKALEADDPENLARLNDLHYRLGLVSESMGNLKAAEEHYNEVASNDYSYADVAQRLRNLNQGPSS